MRDDDDNFETILDPDGRPARILRDGRSTRISMTMRDGSPVFASRVSDGSGNRLGLNKPGWRTHNPRFTDAMNEAKIAALNDYERRLVDAWKASNDDDDDGDEGAEGSACTVRNAQYPLDFGAAGHIRNGVCVPDEPRGPAYPINGDSRAVAQIARDHQKHMAEVYALRDAELAAAWRRK